MNQDRSNTLRQVNWWWLRHAPTDAKGHMIGSTDLEAILPDAEDLHVLSRSLPEEAVFLVSPLTRCRQTAEALFAEANWQIMEDFREQNFGDWENCSYDQPEIRNSGAFWRDPGNTAPPGGESFAHMSDRVQTAISGQQTSGDKIVVAHAGVIRAAVALALELAPHQALRLQIDPLSLTRMTWFEDPDNPAGSWSLQCLNQSLAG